MEGFDVALDVEQRCPQLVGDVADETALGGVEFHLPGEVLDGDGDALEGFAAGIPHRLENDAQGAGRFAETAAHVRALFVVLQQALEGGLQLDIEPFGQFLHQAGALQIAALPAEEAPGGGIHQHHPSFGIQQQGPIRHGGDQGLLLHLGRGQLLDVGFVVGLQLGGHVVEAVEQFAQFPTHRQGDPGFEIPARDGAHAPQQFLDRLGDGQGVEDGPQDHQDPDRDEDRHGDLAA